MFKSLSQAKQAVKQKLFSYVGRGVKDVSDTVGSGIIPPVGFKVGEIFVDTERAMRFTAVYAAIRLRSETISSLPKAVLELTPSGRMDAAKHSVYKLIKYRPNGFMNVFTFWEYTNACLDGWGNAFVLIKRDKWANPVELIPIHPRLVTVVFRNARKWFIVAGSQSFDGTYADDDVLHFFSLSMDGIKGVNPIVYNSAAISSGMSAQNFGNEFFQQGGNVKAVLETEKRLGASEMDSFLKSFEESKNFGTPVLDQGVKYKSVGIAPEAAQMLQTRTFALQDIARIFNIPPHMIADLSRATFSNIEHQDIQYAKYSIRPSVKRYEQEMDRKLFFDDELGRYETKFNLNGLMRGDMTSRANYYQKAVLTGWLSRNEVREMENMNKVDGLDDMLYPGNEIIVEK
nr:MAG TPA: portal protein [Caudoviricetes sp.]